MKGTFTRAAFVGIAREAATSGGTTAKAEKRMQSGGGLDPLVDPSGGGIHGPIRLSLPRLVEIDGKWQLVMGPPIVVENLLDTTGSMGGNVDLAFNVLPDSYEMLTAVLTRYDLQIINAIFGDRDDRIILCRSQAEMAEKIAIQLTLMTPERDGKDAPEDPEYGLFGAAYLTKARLHEWGLKSYHFLLTDAPGRGEITNNNLVRVFGKEVIEKVGENGHQLGGSLPDTRAIVTDLQTRAHAFLLQVGGHPSTNRFWTPVYGQDHVIKLPSMKFLPQVQAAVIGLTEGTLTLKGLKGFLTKTGKMHVSDADDIVRAVSHIPVGAQTLLPNFNKIPEKGSMFKTKTSLWPIGHEFGDEPSEDSGGKPKKPATWL